MKKLIALCAAAALLVGAFAPEIAAAEKKAATKEKSAKAAAKRDTYPYRGVIGSIDGDKITLKLKTKDRAITVASDAKIISNGKKARLSDLKAGAYITGQVKKVDGKEIAVSVYEKPKPAPKAKK